MVFKGQFVIIKFIERFRVLIWNWRQPLTVVPKNLNGVVSDLFIWRASNEWETYFELLDVVSLFEDSQSLNFVDIKIFNKSGFEVLQKKITLNKNSRQLINISNLISEEWGNVGTFAVFHSKNPTVVKELGSNIAERGYVSYTHKNSLIRSYVHGNLDAVTKMDDGKIELLGGASFLQRKYNLQYKFSNDAVHEIALVNPTNKQKKITFQVVSFEKGKVVDSKLIQLKPAACEIFKIKTGELDGVRLIIKSRLVMARPLIFSTKNFNLNVFHG